MFGATCARVENGIIRMQSRVAPEKRKSPPPDCSLPGDIAEVNAMRKLKKTSKEASIDGFVYLLWCEYSAFFKIGFSAKNVRRRVMDISTNCPMPIRVVAVIPGSTYEESIMHRKLIKFRTNGEWFSLPEEVVWQVLHWFGAKVPENVKIDSRKEREIPSQSH